MPSKTKLKHFLPGQIRFSCVCWRIWETDQDGPGEIHWNFASRNTMPARLTGFGRIWPLSTLLGLREYSILNICDQILLASNFKSQKKTRSSKVSNPIFLSWKRNSREGCLWCWQNIYTLFANLPRNSSKVSCLDRLANSINQRKEDWKKIIENYLKSRTYGTTNIIKNNEISEKL